MKKRTKLILTVFIGLFILLFLGRFAYDLLQPAPPAIVRGFQAGFNNDIAQSSSSWELGFRKNYASAKIAVNQATAGTQILEQKYERTASLSAASSDFEADSRKASELAKGLSAVVQSENAYGLPGARTLSLSFGVSPANFEALTEGLQKIGALGSVTVVKKDKTADFKALEAKRLSLEKTRDGLRALKAPGAALADLVALETKILEIEGQIQELGVSLGDFDEVNSMCTVNYSLSERAAANPGARIAGAFFEALGWSVLVYLGFSLCAALAFGSAILLSRLIDRLRGMAGQEKQGQ